MLETVILCAFGFLMLAAATHRFRGHSGVRSRQQIAGVRAVGVIAIAIALIRCEAPLDGERWVRLICGASIGGGMIVILLSATPARTLGPLRRLFARN